MSDIIINKKNEVYLTLLSEQFILQELQDKFTFYAENYKFNPKYKNKQWDGKIRLLKFITKTKGQIYYGLLDEIIEFCKNNQYTYELNDVYYKNDISKNDIIEYISKEQITAHNKKIEVRDYQLDTVYNCIKNKRQVIISATSSGKSLSQYLIVKYLNNQNLKGLIIVPNINLIHQLYNDFIDYSKINNWNVENNIHKIYQGQEKINNKPIILSTYQSLILIKDKKFFEQFDYVIVDETHRVKTNSLIKILEQCINTSYRIGLTGSLDNINSNIKTIIGLLGPKKEVISSKELINRKEATDILIKCLILNYDKETTKILKKYKYQNEINYIITNNKRNIFIKNLALSLKNNTIILCNFVETHGKVLYELINNSKFKGNRKVYFIHGKVCGEERERIRQIMEIENDSIIIATSSIMSTGVSIKNLHNLIFAISGKSRIRNIQSIGRLLRLNDNKEKAVLYDIVDNLSIGKHKNFTLNHFFERIKIYNSEQFDYKVYNIDFPQL